MAKHTYAQPYARLEVHTVQTASTMPHAIKPHVSIRLSLSSNHNGRGASSSISRCSTLIVGIIEMVSFALQQIVVVGTAFLKKGRNYTYLGINSAIKRTKVYPRVCRARDSQKAFNRIGWQYICNFSIQRLPNPHCCNETKCTTLEPKKSMSAPTLNDYPLHLASSIIS